MIGESPTTCSFHLRQLAKYGFIEEVAGVAGRKRPWRLVHTGLTFSDVSEDPETRLAATALTWVLHEFYLDRLKEGLALRRDTPTEWQKATGASEFLLYVTVEELHELDEQMNALVKPFVERIGNPKKRPKGAAPSKCCSSPIRAATTAPTDNERKEEKRDVWFRHHRANSCRRAATLH